MRLEGKDFTQIWHNLLHTLIMSGQPVSPRGQHCQERLGVTLHLTHALNNILVCPMRKPSYRFMVAEWLYIWFGHDDVKTIARYNPNIAQFSDNGVDFNGAYGPPVVKQWPFVLAQLRQDRDTRQAVLLIWRTPVGPTKDVPCTLTLQFLIRQNKLHTIASMRSSDVWLGLPYDVFTFTMLGNILAAQLGATVGSFTIHLGSSHIYERDIFQTLKWQPTGESGLNSPQLLAAPPSWLDTVLREPYPLSLASSEYNRYARVLNAVTNVEALKHLRE